MTFLKLKIKLSMFKDKLQEYLINFKDKYIVREIYIKGGEGPPKSFAFENKFIILYALFTIYSLLLTWGVNNPGNIIIYFVTFGNPFVLGASIVAFFLTLSIIINNNKTRYFLFGEYSIPKQIGLYIGIIIGYYFLFLFTYPFINYTTLFLALSLIWMILLSSRYYIYSRKFATKVEARIIRKYSMQRYLGALIAPLVILVILVILSILYRSLIVWLTLDFFSDFNPNNLLAIYNTEMDIVMPFIYFSLVMTFVFVILEYFSTRRKAETKRVGTFDNFTFAVIIMFIFFFQIFQMTIFLILKPETMEVIRAWIGTGGSAISFIFILEFIISTIILYRVVLLLGKSYGWELLFFKRDGLILFFLGCIMAQSLTRYTLTNEVINQDITLLGNILLADKYIISIVMIVFLGITLLIYYIKPQETSMFMSSASFIVDKEEQSMDTVYKLLKNEYIKRGAPYPIEILERELIKSTKLSKAVLYSLITRLGEKEVDIKLQKKLDRKGEKVYWIEFLSITETYEKKSVAKKKARSFLTEQLIESTSKKDKHTLKEIGKGVKKTEAPGQLISSLSNRYDKKEAAKRKMREINQNKDLSFKSKGITGDLIDLLIQAIEEQYNARIIDPKQYPQLYPKISEVAKIVQEKTKITAGDLFPLLEKINKRETKIKLIRNLESPEDKRIWIRDLSDYKACVQMKQFRPNEYLKLQKLLIRRFCNNLQYKYPKNIISKLYSDVAKSEKKTDATLLWRHNLSVFIDYITEYHSYLLESPKLADLRKCITLLTKK